RSRAAGHGPALRGRRRHPGGRPVDAPAAGHPAAQRPLAGGRGGGGGARGACTFGASITFAGNLPGGTQTMPLTVYIALETDLEAAIALSLILLFISLAVLIALRDRWFPTA